ncbi:MAG: phosphate signaling complex protein PhoU [Alphaproteobacteria bacterium]|nr:phosphate signaling complex protein PhoU [Alphaproteobacteria bacterium]
MSQTHIVKKYDEDLKQLNDLLARMGGLAEAQLKSAVDSVVRRDSDMAARTIESDNETDDLEMQIDDRVVNVLALRQPVAADLREVVSALKVSNELERVADYATNVAKRAIRLNEYPAIQSIAAIPRMAEVAQQMIKDVLDAYINRDVDKAMDVWHRDDDLDALHTALFRELLTYMMEDPRNITPCTHMLFIAKNIERIGDHATNIAEMCHFLVNGGPFVESRPKAAERAAKASGNAA